MSIENLTDSDIYKFHQKKVDELTAEVNEMSQKFDALKTRLKRAEEARDFYLEESNLTKKEIANIVKASPSSSNVNKGLSVAERAEFVLRKSKIPLTSRELLDLINETWNDRNWKFREFSGLWSQNHRNPNKPFKQIEYTNNPTEIRFFYGLKDWFEGEKLKEEYKQKLSEKFKLNQTEPLFNKTSEQET